METFDYHIKLYREFCELDKSDFQEKIRFVELNRLLLKQLSSEQWAKVEIEYCLCLFKVKAYFQFLNHVDRVIEMVVTENIYHYEEEDIYKSLLYKKAIASMHVIDHYKAEYILQELKRMGEDKEVIRSTFVKNAIEKLRYEGQLSRSITLLLFFLAAFVIAVEILYIRNFHSEWSGTVAIIRNTIFGLGLANLFFQELRIRWKARQAYNKIK